MDCILEFILKTLKKIIPIQWLPKLLAAFASFLLLSDFELDLQPFPPTKQKQSFKNKQEKLP